MKAEAMFVSLRSSMGDRTGVSTPTSTPIPNTLGFLCWLSCIQAEALAARLLRGHTLTMYATPPALRRDVTARPDEAPLSARAQLAITADVVRSGRKVK